MKNHDILSEKTSEKQIYGYRWNWIDHPERIFFDIDDL